MKIYAKKKNTYLIVFDFLQESILRYENFVREHQNFDRNYKEFFGLVKKLSDELTQYSEVVGDLGLLQVYIIFYFIS